MRKKKRLLLLTAAVALAVLVAAMAALRVPAIRRDIREESRAAIRDAVIRSAVTCYAVEGVYPPSLEYLETHYGLAVNHRDFIVTYEAFAGNLLPSVQVLVRGEG